MMHRQARHPPTPSPPNPIPSSAARLSRRPLRRKSREPRGERRLHDAPPATLSRLFTQLRLLSASRCCSRSSGQAVLGSLGPYGVAGNRRGERGRRAAGRWRAALKRGARGPCGRGGRGGAGGQRARPGWRGRRTAGPGSPGLGGGACAAPRGAPPRSFWPGSRPPPPSSPPQRCLRAKGGAPVGRRGKRGRDQGADVGEPEGAAPPPRRLAVGQPEGQRHLRAGGRRFLAAWGRGGGPEDSGRGEAGGPHCPWADGRLARRPRAQGPSAWPRAADWRRSDTPGRGLTCMPPRGWLGDVCESGLSSHVERLGEPVFPAGESDHSRCHLPVESYSNTFDHPSRVRREKK